MRRLVVAVAVGTMLLFPSIPAANAACSPHWTAVAPPGGYTARDVVAIDVNTAWEVATNYPSPDPWVASYDGTEWTRRTVPTPGEFTDVVAVDATAEDDVWMVGAYTPSDLTDSNAYIVHWDGASFTRYPLDPTGLRYESLLAVDALSPNDVWAVGEHWVDPTVGYQSLAAHWDGVAWSVVPTPMPGNGRHLFGVEMISTRDVWAVGWKGTTFSKPLTLHWNGFGWRTIPAPAVAPSGTELYAVSGHRHHRVWAVGTAGFGQQPLTMRWDGESWTIVPAPSTTTDLNFLSGVADVVGTQAWAVGSRGGRFGHPLLLRWNGTAWRQIRLGTERRTLAAIDEAPDRSMMIVGSHETFAEPFALQRCPAP
jgi:hypothetical protein